MDDDEDGDENHDDNEGRVEKYVGVKVKVSSEIAHPVFCLTSNVIGASAIIVELLSMCSFAVVTS